MVESTEATDRCGEADLVTLSRIDGDATGAELTVLWQAEPDARVLHGDPWSRVGGSRFDPTDGFGAPPRILLATDAAREGPRVRDDTA